MPSSTDEPPVLAGPDEAADPQPASGAIGSLVTDLRQLACDAKTLAEAELAYQSSRARLAAASTRNIAVLGVVAFVLAFFALGALAVGLLLALTPLITAWGATAVVAGGLALGAVLCALAAGRHWSRMRRALTGNDDGPGA